jgi:hypothetical protein
VTHPDLTAAGVSPAALAEYRAQRDRFLALGDRADVAWRRWFDRTIAGERTNGAAAQRLANLANYASADLAQAESPLWDAGVDPHDVDVADGRAWRS